ncbi:hypothetical protein [Cellulomonas sp. JZ18]|uniref:hypothetical protein n=1 Tax=Cellulomonas sp. JZ18 TaxID=2654191 RepID=UPI001E5161F9|nr:hypothetical protein [Cellulomonas sp. JZ18]
MRLLDAEHGVLTRDSATGAVSAVFVNYPADMGRRPVGSADSYAETRALAEVGPARRVRHVVEGLPPGARFAVERVDWEHGNVAEAWHAMGEPLNLTREQTARLREAADDLWRTELVVDADGVLEIDLDLPPWAVVSVAPAA